MSMRKARNKRNVARRTKNSNNFNEMNGQDLANLIKLRDEFYELHAWLKQFNKEISG